MKVRERIMKKILKYIILHTIYKMKYLYQYRKYRKSTSRQYLLFGVPNHGNIGDHAILVAEHQFLQDIGIKNVFDIPIEMQDILIKTLKKYVNKEDVILITGGGFIGSQWMQEENMVRQVLSTFPNNKTIIFPSTIYYKNDEDGKTQLEIDKNIYQKHKKLIICAREEITYNWLKETYPEIQSILTPDIVLYLTNYNSSSQREKEVLLCLRKDTERNIDEDKIKYIENTAMKYGKVKYTDTVVKRRITEKSREKELKDKLNEFSKAELVITDRLHGMIFAAITETPCIAIGNYNYKVKGVYEWIKSLEYIKFIEEVEQLDERMQEVLQYTNRRYLTDINKKYDVLKSVLMNNKI